MGLFEQVNADIKDAMKSKDKERLEVLRYLKSMLMENKTSKNPVGEQDVLIRHSKKMKDAIDTYPAGSELQTKAIKEVAILATYLPKGLEEDEVITIINDIITSQGTPNMGSIMRELTPQIKGRFDGKRANDLVKAALGQA